MTDALARLTAALSDRYTIEVGADGRPSLLGAGGMATVYLAQDLKHHRKVAVKVLRPELAAVIGAERFLHEITTTANLQHPHILALHDSGTVDGTVFYVMPFVEGETLRDRIAREKQLPIEEAVRITREVAGALDYAHRHGVIHRDIKSENILLHDGSALVADFGIALAATTAGGGRMTETGMSLGTPTYMSPEQAMGERALDARTDIYALGCVLYEMLTGEPPFSGPTAQAIVAKVMTADPVRPCDLRKTVPAHLEAATLTALAKLPADRFASAHAFADALSNSTFTLPAAGTTVRQAAPLAGGSRSRLRDPLVLGLGVTTIALAGLALMLLRRPGAEPALRPIRFLYAGGDSARVITNYPWPAAISPDGGTLVYSVAEHGGGTIFYTRRTDQLEAHP
ncbi:MAG: serine/threonine-protein kinase, partial [Gemmatimonadales bacterium]